jgi:hypothetical protein
MKRILCCLMLVIGSAAAAASAEWRLASTGAGYELVADEQRIATFDGVAAFGEASGKIALLAVAQMAGPTQDIVLVDGSAWFASVRAGAERRSIAQNMAQGQYDLNRLSLVNGELEKFGLPPETGNPRVMQAGNQVYVHLGGGADVVFDAGSKAFARVDAIESARLGLSPAVEPALSARPVIPIPVHD